MMARLHTGLPAGNDWLCEVKLDGIRALIVKNAGSLKLWSRRPRDMTADYPELVAALGRLPAGEFVADGEIVALDPEGRSSFRLLQNLKQDDSPPIRLYLFDLLNLDGRDLKRLPIEVRKGILQSLVQRAGEPLRFSSTLEGEPGKIWPRIQQLGLEGIIAKRSESVYEPGVRSGAWLKIKTQSEQEFVIGGYTQPEGSRNYFGSLVVGYYEGKQLRFASRVGTGFNQATLKSLYQKLQPLRVEGCPFDNLPVTRPARFGHGLSRAEMKRCVWIKPQLVCQVKFFEWTRHDQLRMPVFLGLRPDKKARSVVRERPA